MPVAFSLALSRSAAALAENQPNRRCRAPPKFNGTRSRPTSPRDGRRSRARPSRIIYPAPVFAVASDPAVVPRTLRACHPPDAILGQLPLDGVLIEVLEATPKGIDGRPAEIKLDRKSFATYECSGPSHSVGFHEHGRGLYIHVWFNQGHVSATNRSDAVDFLNSIEVGVFGSRECPGAPGARADPSFEGADGLSCREGDDAGRTGSCRRSGCSAVRACSPTATRFEATDRIACQAVERFVLEDFAPHPGGWIERSSRFDCRIRSAPAAAGITSTVSIRTVAPRARTFAFDSSRAQVRQASPRRTSEAFSIRSRERSTRTGEPGEAPIAAGLLFAGRIEGVKNGIDEGVGTVVLEVVAGVRDEVEGIAARA